MPLLQEAELRRHLIFIIDDLRFFLLPFASLDSEGVATSVLTGTSTVSDTADKDHGVKYDMICDMQSLRYDYDLCMSDITKHVHQFLIIVCVADIIVVLAERKLTSYVYAVDVIVSAATDTRALRRRSRHCRVKEHPLQTYCRLQINKKSHGLKSNWGNSGAPIEEADEVTLATIRR
ncbi:hypothetical protein TIFTF001_040819 [Ficus carica]|uniref:Uncharacterized protein n=1 Tax=Ficus carica TaxID=3494 RepID=A0AA87ZH28_FICCA|nr:hypothetical protein TIFTF001_040817 [Ficus carica]GMN26218.1 hypothetical protein TIFTF001_040819 [Ficus carica]